MYLNTLKQNIDLHKIYLAKMFLKTCGIWTMHSLCTFHIVCPSCFILKSLIFVSRSTITFLHISLRSHHTCFLFVFPPPVSSVWLSLEYMTSCDSFVASSFTVFPSSSHLCHSQSCGFKQRFCTPDHEYYDHLCTVYDLYMSSFFLHSSLNGCIFSL